MLHIFGHRAPDTDSIASAIAYAFLKNELKAEAKAFRLGEINEETKFVLEKFKVEPPEILESAEGKDVILVDHNEFEQSAKGIEKANLVEIIDHHKLKLSWPKPIFVLTLPWGSTATIITKLFELKKVEIPKTIAGVLAAAILSDTVIFKSPTTTQIDKEVAKKLAEIAGIQDLEKFGIEMFKIKSRVADKSVEELLKKDYKTYDFKGRKIWIAQIEVVDDEEVLKRKGEILEFMKEFKEKENLYAAILMVTNILKEGSTLFLVTKEIQPFEKAFNLKFEEGIAWAPGVMSRKKQVVPPLEKVFS